MRSLPPPELSFLSCLGCRVCEYVLPCVCLFLLPKPPHYFPDTQLPRNLPIGWKTLIVAISFRTSLILSFLSPGNKPEWKTKSIFPVIHHNFAATIRKS